MASQCSRKRTTIAWLIPIAVHVTVVLACLISRSPGESSGYCGVAYHEEMITVTVLAGPLFSAPAALFVIEAIVEYPSIDNVIPGLLIFVVILPVVIWSCVLFAMLIQGKIRHTRTFLWQFAVLYCYGVAISLLMNFAVALASV